jgi:hypothetical protein
MSFLDKAKEKATQLTATVKDKADDIQNKKKADDLLDDIGRIVYRQHTEGTMPDDTAAIDALVAQLKTLEDAGTKILDDKAPTDAPAAGTPPPPAPSAPMPPPPSI